MGTVKPFRESGLCTEGPLGLEGVPQRGDGQLKRMRYCGRLFNDSKERAGKKNWWHNHLNPNINKEAWTQQKELALIRSHQVYGNNKVLTWKDRQSNQESLEQFSEKEIGLLLGLRSIFDQFQGLPLVVHQNQPIPSSSSGVQSSEDNTNPRNGIEAGEISECSQGSTVVGCSQSMSGLGNAAFHGRGEFQLREDPGVAREQSSTPASCLDHYFVSVRDARFSVPDQVPLEVGCFSNFLP